MANCLVIEDEPTVRVLVGDLLETWGHQVVGASSGGEAIERLRESQYDLVVLDLMLGVASGFDVLDEMRRLGVRDSTRVVVLTARATEWDYLLGWMRGADEYLTKPFDPTHFERVVRETLSSSADELEERRRGELEKSQLLFKLEKSFHETPDAGGDGPNR
jgi:DNA-binding response OmpR family regulator